ncbi:MAG: hypothetical protein VB108_00275 [Anaerolineaceae bacterium]|nr:hypothetical protein [Anaerolineaceae bacterium]
MDKKDSTTAQKAGKRKKALRLRHAQRSGSAMRRGKTDVDLHSESPYRGWRNMGSALLKSLQAYLDNLRQET